MFPHLDHLESTCVVHGPRPPEMARVVVLGFVVRISLDPRRTPAGSVRNHAIEQCRGDPVPSERRGDDEARDSDHGCRLGFVGIGTLLGPDERAAQREGRLSAVLSMKLQTAIDLAAPT
jgi:hypothetical protein